MNICKILTLFTYSNRWDTINKSIIFQKSPFVALHRQSFQGWETSKQNRTATAAMSEHDRQQLTLVRITNATPIAKRPINQNKHSHFVERTLCIRQ